MKRYYLLIVTTMYDGLEFTQNLAVERKQPMTQKQVEKEATKYLLHEDSGEELEKVEFIEITKEEYDVLRKYHI